MNTDLFRTFLVAADSRSFSQAAKQLYITPSAVVQQIKNLESLTGFALFDRSPEGISLTPSGERFLAGIHDLGSAYAALVQECLGISHSPEALRVGLSPNSNQPFLMAVCERFEQEHQGELQTVPIYGTTAKAQALAKGQIDICVLTNYDNVDSSIIQVEPLFETPPFAVAYRSHLLLKQPFCSLDDLAACNVGVWENAALFPFLTDSAAIHAGVKISDVFRDIGAVQAFCIAGGVFVAGQPVVSSIGESFGHIPLACEATVQYCIAWRRDTHPNTARFIEMARQLAVKRQ